MHRSFAILLATIGLASLRAVAADGDLDTTFGDGGIARLGSGDSSYVGYGPVIVADDGRIITCTRGISADGLRFTDFLARLNADGSKDATFGADGLVDLDSTVSTPDCMGLAPQADGRIVIARHAWVGEQIPHADSETLLQRFDANGRLDEGFGEGTGATHVNLAPGALDGIIQFAPQADGRLVIAAAIQPAVFAVARLLADGAPDPSFGSHGVSRMNLPDIAGISTYIGALFIDAHGRIVVTGTIDASGGHVVAARFLPDGSPDLHFGQRGLAAIAFADNASASFAVPLQDGRIVIAGNHCWSSSPTTSGGCGIALARMQDDGSIDASFGDGGTRTIAMSHADGALDFAMAGMRRPEDGKIVLVGSTKGEYSQRYGLVLQLEADGTPDETFAPQGVRTIDIPPVDDRSKYLRGVFATAGRTIVLGASFGAGTLDMSQDFVIALKADVHAHGHSRHERPGPPLPSARTAGDRPR